MHISRNLHIVCVHLRTSFKKNFFPIITNTTFQTGIAFYDHIFCLLSKICNSGWQTQQEWAKLEKLWDITYYLPTSLRLRKKMPKCHPQCGSHTPVSRFSAQTLSYLLHNDAASETGTDLKTVLFVFCLRCICDILAIFSIALVIGRIASRYLCMFFLV